MEYDVADPILADGMSLAMVGAREAAYLLGSLLRGEHDEQWLKDWYSEGQRRRISHHIKFAHFWYSANAHFSELKEYTSQIATDAGLQLDPEEAFRWLGTGGFVTEDFGRQEDGAYSLGHVKSVVQAMTGTSAEWEFNRYNHLVLNLEGAEVVHLPFCAQGRIQRVKCFRRGERVLPMQGAIRQAYRALTKERTVRGIARALKAEIGGTPGIFNPDGAFRAGLEAIEGMLIAGWVTGSVREGVPFLRINLDPNCRSINDP